MNDSTFWSIIDAARGEVDADDCHAFADALVARLSALPPAEIVGFELRLSAKMNESYTHALWGAAYLINGGCSDDGFDYFRGWLVTQGERVFRAAVANPDSLADVVRPSADSDFECEDVLGVARRAYKKAAKAEMPDPPPPDAAAARASMGEDWDFDDEEEMARRLPRLSAMFSGAGD